MSIGTRKHDRNSLEVLPMINKSEDFEKKSNTENLPGLKEILPRKVRAFKKNTFIHKMDQVKSIKLGSSYLNSAKTNINDQSHTSKRRFSSTISQEPTSLETITTPEKMKFLLEKCQNLEVKCEDLEFSLQNSKSVEEKNKKLELEIENLGEKCAKLEKTNKELEEKIGSLEKEKENLQIELSSARNTLLISNHPRRKTVDQTLIQLMAGNSNELVKFNSVEAENISKLNCQCKELLETNSNLVLKLESLNEKIKILNETVETLQLSNHENDSEEKVKIILTKNKELFDKLLKFSDKIYDQNNEICTLSKKNEMFHKELKETKLEVSEIHSLREHVTTLLKVLRNVRQGIKNISQKHSEASNEVENHKKGIYKDLDLIVDKTKTDLLSVLRTSFIRKFYNED